MTILERVRQLVVRISPDEICDDCLADKLQLADRQRANAATRELAAEARYIRSQDQCALCDQRKKVISYR
jgi:hypothetical protein